MMKEPFAPIPNSILRRSDISPGSKLCYARLVQYKGDGKTAYPSLNRLAEDLGVSRRQIINYVKELEISFLLKVEKRQGIRNEYTLLLPPVQNTSPVQDVSPVQNTSPVQDVSPTGEESFTGVVQYISPEEKRKRKGKEKIYTGKAINERFFNFWEQYPKRNGRKTGKAKTEKLFSGLSVSDQEQILTAVKHYAASGQFAKDPERFIKADYWRDWLEPVTPEANRNFGSEKSIYVGQPGELK